MPRVLAVDLGGTKTATAIIDHNGTVEEFRKGPAARTLSEMVGGLADLASDVDAVGIIIPGIFSPRTGFAWCPNLWGMDEVPLLETLQSRLAVPVVIDSDRSGYVLGEAWLGVARGLGDVAFVAIGTGIGIGILSGGQVIRGAHGIAGAAGWSSLSAEWKDIYEQCGCWESEAAGPAVARLAHATDAQAVVAAARAGDPKAAAVLANAANYTGRGVANLISLLNPEMIVLGGGFMAGASDLLLPGIRAEVARWAQPIAAQRCRIELTTLGERAGLMGAARLALDGV
jgi:glucokinase